MSVGQRGRCSFVANCSPCEGLVVRLLTVQVHDKKQCTTEEGDVYETSPHSPSHLVTVISFLVLAKVVTQTEMFSHFDFREPKHSGTVRSDETA